MTIEQDIQEKIAKCAKDEIAAIDANDFEAWCNARVERNYQEGRLRGLFDADGCPDTVRAT